MHVKFAFGNLKPGPRSRDAYKPGACSKERRQEISVTAEKTVVDVSEPEKHACLSLGRLQISQRLSFLKVRHIQDFNRCHLKCHVCG